MKLTLTIDTDNAAFADDDGLGTVIDDALACDLEVARILCKAAKRFEDHDGLYQMLIDSNGNNVGRVTFTT